MEKRFNDGIIDLSALREKKKQEEEAVPVAPVSVDFDPNNIMKTIPSTFDAEDEQGNTVTITVLSAAIMPDKIYLILSENDTQPFLMIGGHDNTAFTEELTPATEEDLNAYNEFVAEYQKAMSEKSQEQIDAERLGQLQEMLELADTEEEREQIRAMMKQ